MHTAKLKFRDADRLKQILDLLIDEFSAKVISVRIGQGIVVVDMDEEVEILGYGDEDLWEQLRRVRLYSYEYQGPFTLAVVKEIFRAIKQQGMVPCYLLLHPEAELKKTAEWNDMAVVTLSGSTFLGLPVEESEALEPEFFIIAAGHSPSAAVPNVTLGVKGQINAVR
jgi:hypothetical protein